MNDWIDELFDRLVADELSTLAREVLLIAPPIVFMLLAFVVVEAFDRVVGLSYNWYSMMFAILVCVFGFPFAYFYEKRLFAAMDREKRAADELRATKAAPIADGSAKWRHSRVRRSRSRMVRQTRTLADHEQVTGSPKTAAGARTIALHPEAVAALRAWRKDQLEERRVMGAGWPGTGLVVTEPTGVPIHPQRLTRRFNGLVTRSGLRVCRLHDVRHATRQPRSGQGCP